MKKAKGKRGVQSRLEEELNLLCRKLGLNPGLRVVWMPDASADLSGEVEGRTIRIYEADEDRALQALRHELLDYLITSSLVKPLVDLINLLIKSREAEIYREKEKLVEALTKLLE